MTTLRTAAQQALEALEDFKRRGHWGDFDNLTGTLKAALVEHYCDTHCTWADHAPGCVRAEPVQQGCDHCNHPMYAAIKCRVCGRKTPIIEPEIKGDNKPVAWFHTDFGSLELSRVQRVGWKPLYAAPPQRKPLTDDEIKKLLIEHAGMTVVFSEVDLRFARAIERAHGIGGSDEA